jgi:transcriptional regulator with XRE-family HTH domain
MAEARAAAGLTVLDAAELLGTKVSNLRRIESGKAKPSPMLRVMMLAAYDADDFADAPSVATSGGGT